jgi:hypothetical protein
MASPGGIPAGSRQRRETRRQRRWTGLRRESRAPPDTLSLTDSAVIEQWPIVRGACHGVDSLALGHTAKVVVNVVSRTLAVTDTGTLLVDQAARRSANTQQLSHEVGFVLVAGDVLHKYRLFIGEVPAITLSATCATLTFSSSGPPTAG